jgi:hypothetical protein
VSTKQQRAIRREQAIARRFPCPVSYRGVTYWAANQTDLDAIILLLERDRTIEASRIARMTAPVLRG